MRKAITRRGPLTRPRGTSTPRFRSSNADTGSVDRTAGLSRRGHERQEALTRVCGLEWVIAPPGRLTNGPAHGRYVKRAEIAPVPGSISRADVADFLVTAADSDDWVGKAVQIGG